MSHKLRRHPVGTICRSRTPIVPLDNDDRSRLCRICDVLPPERWRSDAVPEYEVELVALPVTAHRSHAELDRLR